MIRFSSSQGLARFIGGSSLVLLAACAAQENDVTASNCSNPKSVACVHSGGTGGGSSSGGSGNSAGMNASGGQTATAGTSATGTSGSSSVGGTDSAAGGTASTTGGAAGTTAIAGSSGTGTTTGGSGAGGASATGGAGGAAAGAGGAHAGGAGGTTSAGGSGGSNSALCTTPVPARTSWIGTASSFSNVCTDPTYGLCNPPAYAFDASLTSRFSTGMPQAGTEWLQIDFTTKGTVDRVTVAVSNGDYGRHLQIRMSDVDKDMAAPVLAEMDGMSGLLTFNFPPKTARFILISQTKALAAGETSWWSVQDVTATCN